jgi:ubiquinone/menaquinone biosynthesis C-methylase UbiE
LAEDRKILDYWNEQALKYKKSVQATSPDFFAFDLEKNVVLSFLRDGQKVLNVGCGNGIKDLEYCRQKKIKLKGTDYSDEMITVANNELKKSIAGLVGELVFEYGDILDLAERDEYDVVITDRCLINLGTEENQRTAIDNIHRSLKVGGKFLMMECTKQGLMRINEVRKGFNLEEIKERWHNNYLSDSIIAFAKEKFAMMEIDNFDSTYFLISRTINALVTKKGEPIDYMSDINKFASKLPAVGDFAPLKLFILTK